MLATAGPAGGNDLILGLDEAGRGSALGPLVVGGFLIAEPSISALPELGVRDSKLLSADRRTSVHAGLQGLGRCVTRSVAPATIDRAVARGRLNYLEAAEFATLIRRTRPARVFVDACDPVAARFGRWVARYARFPEHRIAARHHADRDLPVVGAASIVAKVARDRAVAGLEQRVGRPIGTGYPADPETRSYLTDLLAGPDPLPPWVRGSWATVRNLKPTAEARRLDAFA